MRLIVKLINMVSSPKNRLRFWGVFFFALPTPDSPHKPWGQSFPIKEAQAAISLKNPGLLQTAELQ